MTVETTRAPTTASPEHPALSGPAGNGLIAYSYDGDIFIGDPVTGTTKAIAPGPASDVNAIFSPDGTRIAFVRGDPYGDASLVVVRADGSDERVVIPNGFTTQGFGPFGWTPDSASLVVNYDGPATGYWDGFLSLIDASGVAEPRLLTPPLPAAIGAQYFDANAQVAPMFRPPDGDLILSPGLGFLDVYDADLVLSSRLAQSFDFEPGDCCGGATWSPDGAMIAFGADRELFVVDFEGGDLRSLGEGFNNPLWSPDSTSIAFERWIPGPDPPRECWRAGSKCTSVIAIIDLAKGTERVLEATSTEQKSGSDFHTITWNTYHTWFYEGWSWSPDGRSLLLLKDHRTRPAVVDIATDTATELPWETDSAPSWQRVATG